MKRTIHERHTDEAQSLYDQAMGELTERVAKLERMNINITNNPDVGYFKAERNRYLDGISSSLNTLQYSAGLLWALSEYKQELEREARRKEQNT